MWSQKGLPIMKSSELFRKKKKCYSKWRKIAYSLPIFARKFVKMPAIRRQILRPHVSRR